MNNIDTISDLLTFSGSQYRIYDIGRRIDKISKDTFSKIELNQQPYPFPAQGHAHIAIIFWQKASSEPFLWFVKFPLDERGLLNQGARNHFIAIIIEALGSDLSVNPTSKQEELLKANPYHFTPAQYKLAAINSKVSNELKQQPSSFYQHALKYLSGSLGWQNWQDVGVQGLTDIVSRLNQQNHQDLLEQAISSLPTEVLEPICLALENEKLSPLLIEALLTRHQQVNRVDGSSNYSENYILRALSSSCSHSYVKKYIVNVLNEGKFSEETAILLASRCWDLFTDKVLLLSFMEKLVTLNDQALFSGLFKDLVSIPSIRPVILSCLREPNRSLALAEALGHIFSQQTNRQSH